MISTAAIYHTMTWQAMANGRYTPNHSLATSHHAELLLLSKPSIRLLTYLGILSIECTHSKSAYPCIEPLRQLYLAHSYSRCLPGNSPSTLSIGVLTNGCEFECLIYSRTRPWLPLHAMDEAARPECANTGVQFQTLSEH